MIKQKISHSNRGKALQNAINSTNGMYKLKGWAQIDEIPTPTKNINGKIIYTAKSTVDYVGISHGRGIAFDAKSTHLTNRFDLKNVHDHQVLYLKTFRDQGGVAFFIRFSG
ncbi:Holliday junction resolvase RecU, partial [Domibacillus aminovorans]